jgi:serine/threonine protein kinase/tetratricopeptide (TPR) repeat protein
MIRCVREQMSFQAIAHYRITGELGQGGMGRVYRAVDTKLNREVAIKVIHKQFGGDPIWRARFAREAQVLASLNHPNVAAIYGLEENAIVMELVPGQTLAERLSDGAFPVEEALRVCGQVAEGLAAAHRKDITHRDIKPANIKVTPDGRVKILDFGLARLTREMQTEGRTQAITVTALTNAGGIVGTPAYMSPEQLRNEVLDSRTDIWAFGCVLWELLQGHPPFYRMSLAETIATVLKSEPEWEVLPEKTPSPVRDLLRDCLQKDLHLRLQDIEEARKRIEGALHAPIIGTMPRSNRAVDSLAVLPFVNTSGDPQMEYLSDGLTENIIFCLSQVAHLRVVSRSAVFRYKGRSDEVLEIGRALGVGAVLSGKVLQRGETLLISAELVDVKSGWQRWGAQYRRKVEDIFVTEEELAKEISENLRVKLTPQSDNQLAKRYTENVEAYHLYLKGRFYWAKRTEEGLQKSIQYFRQAIELDPTYALAYAGVAEGYVPLAVYCHVAPKDGCPKARAAALAALEIDPQLAEARTVLGAGLAFYDWDVPNAEKELRQAIDLNPKYARARQSLAEVLTICGRFDEAKVEARRALDLDPLALSLNAFMSMTYYFTREYDKAIDYGRTTVEMDPSFFPGYFYMGLAYQMAGRFDEASIALQKAKELSHNCTLMLASLGGVFAACGQQEEARKILDELEQMRHRKYVSQVFVAAILAALGEIEGALASLEAAYEDRCTWLPRCLAADARLDRLRNQPRFQALVRRMSISSGSGER